MVFGTGLDSNKYEDLGQDNKEFKNSQLFVMIFEAKAEQQKMKNKREVGQNIVIKFIRISKLQEFKETVKILNFWIRVSTLTIIN